MTVKQVLKIVDDSQHTQFPVIDEDGQIVGTIATEDLFSGPEGGCYDCHVHHFMNSEFCRVTADLTMDRVLHAMLESDNGHAVVVDTMDPRKMIGFITKVDVLSSYERAILKLVGAGEDIQKTIPIPKVKVFDYKVYVTGPFQAGKTTFISTLDPYAIFIERQLKEPYRGEQGTTTIGFDKGRVIWVRKELSHKGLIISKNDFQREKAEYGGWIIRDIELRGVPGQLHFKFVRDTQKFNTDGVLMMVDSSNPTQIGDAIAILAETHTSFSNTPIVIIANKQDRADAVKPEDVASWLGVQDTIGSSDKDHRSAMESLIQLLKLLEKNKSLSLK